MYIAEIQQIGQLQYIYNFKFFIIMRINTQKKKEKGN